MELKNILQELEGVAGDGQTKLANAATPAEGEKTSAAREKLIGALDEVLTSGAEATKVAAADTSPPASEELLKMAESMATGEAEALQKEAAFYGAAVADGFMARIGQYEQATAGQQPEVKIAGADGIPTEEEFNKFAAANPDLTKQAVELGYLHGKAQIEELRKQAFVQGYQDASGEIEELSKTAEGRVKLAAIAEGLNKEAAAAEAAPETTVAAALQKLAQTDEGAAKVADIRQGYEDTNAEMAKVAEDCFSRGYSDTIRVLKAM